MATRRNGAAAVARKRSGALRTSGRLTLIYREMYEPSAAMITPLDVIKVLNKAGVRFVLMGTHGVGGYRDQSRATRRIQF